MRSESFEPSIAAVQRPQKYASDCEPHGIGMPSATLVMLL